MKRAPTLCLTALITLLSLRPALAAEEPRRSPFAGVAALEKPVTFTETKIPLGELVQKIAAETGVKLTATREVADEPVAVVVKELPARELLEQLADLLDYLWSKRGKAGEERYEIWQDLAAKQREEGLRRARLAAIEQRVRDQLEVLAELSHLSPAQMQAGMEEAQKRNQEVFALPPEQQLAAPNSPEYQKRLRRIEAAQQLSTPIRRALGGVLGHLSPQRWKQLQEENGLVFSTDPAAGELPLPGELVSRFRAAPVTPPPVEFRVTGTRPGEDEEIRAQDEILQRHWASAGGYRVALSLAEDPHRGPGARIFNLHVMPLNPTAASPNDGFGGGDFGLYFQVEPARRPLAAPGEMASPLHEREKDPVLGARHAFRPQARQRPDYAGPGSGSGWRFRDLLPDLARTYDVSIIADAYGSGPLVHPSQLSAAEPLTLWQLLQHVPAPGYQIDRSGRLVRLRNRLWYLERPREIPLRLIRRWTGLVEQHGALPMAEYVRLVSDLNEEQIQSLSALGRDGAFASLLDLAGLPMAIRELRLYASLSPGQQRVLWQGGVVLASQLTPAQRRLFEPSLRQHVRSINPPPAPEQIGTAGLSLMTHRLVRIREQQGELVTLRDEPAPSPAAPSGDGPPPGGGAGDSSVPPTRVSGSVRRYSVLRLSFLVRVGPVGSGWGGLVIAAPTGSP